jgi:hypothetical protein
LGLDPAAEGERRDARVEQSAAQVERKELLYGLDASY